MTFCSKRTTACFFVIISFCLYMPASSLALKPPIDHCVLFSLSFSLSLLICLFSCPDSLAFACVLYRDVTTTYRLLRSLVNGFSFECCCFCFVFHNVPRAHTPRHFASSAVLSFEFWEGVAVSFYIVGCSTGSSSQPLAWSSQLLRPTTSTYNALLRRLGQCMEQRMAHLEHVLTSVESHSDSVSAHSVTGNVSAAAATSSASSQIQAADAIAVEGLHLLTQAEQIFDELCQVRVTTIPSLSLSTFFIYTHIHTSRIYSLTCACASMPLAWSETTHVKTCACRPYPLAVTAPQFVARPRICDCIDDGVLCLGYTHCHSTRVTQNTYVCPDVCTA
jgi:hypothetical protein